MNLFRYIFLFVLFQSQVMFAGEVGLLEPEILYSPGEGVDVNQICIADFNGDGKEDVVNLSMATNELVFFEGPDFKDPISIPASSPKVATAADFDGDGRMDLIFASSTDHEVVLWNQFAFRTILSDNGSGWMADISGLCSGDFDRDGDLDLLMYVIGSSGTWLLEQPDNPLDDWELQFIGDGPGNWEAIVTMDVNHDGLMDIVGTHIGDMFWNDYSLGVLSNRSRADSFSLQSLAISGTRTSRLLGHSRMGRDLFEDIYTFDDADVVIRNFKSHHSTFLEYLQQDKGAVLSAAAGDLDNDGDGDLIYATGQGVFWMELQANANGSIDLVGIHTLSNDLTNVVQIEVFDIFEDGDLDILLREPGQSSIFFVEQVTMANKVYVGSSSDTPIGTYDSDFNDIALADLNDDGILDVFAPLKNARDRIEFIQPLEFTTPWPFQLENQLCDDVSMAYMADMNLDSYDDFIQPSKDGQQFGWDPGDGEGPAYFNPNVPSPAAVVVDDFDLDGDPDIVVADYWDVSGTTSRYMEQTSADQSGTIFDTHQFTPSLQRNTMTLLSSDLNGDKRPDLITLADFRGVSVYLNRGLEPDGNIRWDSSGIIIPYLDHPMSIKIADMNGDGRDDIVICHKEDRLQVYITKTAPLLPLGLEWESVSSDTLRVGSPTSFCLTDADGDCDQDIIFAQNEPASPSIIGLCLFEQNVSDGEISFEYSSIYTRDSLQNDTVVKQMLVDDLDLDGDPEIIYVNSNSTGSTIHRVELAQSQYEGVATGQEASGMSGTRQLLFSFSVSPFGIAGLTGNIALDKVIIPFLDHDLVSMPSDTVKRILPKISFYRDADNDGEFDPRFDTHIWDFDTSGALPTGGLTSIQLPDDPEWIVWPQGKDTFFAVGTLGYDLSQGCYLEGEFTFNLVQSENHAIPASNYRPRTRVFSLTVNQSTLHFHIEEWPQLNVLELITDSEHIISCDL